MSSYNSSQWEVNLCSFGGWRGDSRGRMQLHWMKTHCASVRRLKCFEVDGVSYWLPSIPSSFASGCSSNAICWLLWAGLVCYIFTVSVMINFLRSLKQHIFKSTITKTQTSASACSLSSFKSWTTKCFSSLFTMFELLFLTLSFDLFFVFPLFLKFLTEWNVPLLLYLLGEYELFIYISMWLINWKSGNCYISSYKTNLHLFCRLWGIDRTV